MDTAQKSVKRIKRHTWQLYYAVSAVYQLILWSSGLVHRLTTCHAFCFGSIPAWQKFVQCLNLSAYNH